MSDLLQRLRSLPGSAGLELVRRNPLSLAQERLWFINRLAAGRGLYAASSGLRLRGPLDEDALWHALDEIVRRHAVLRTRFPEIDGTPFQLVEPPRPVTRRLTDLSALDDPARGRVLSALIRQEARGFADLGAAPPLRLRLARLGAGDHCLIVAIHHIASDRWSAGLFAEELSELYSARVEGRPDRLPVLPIQFADYARWERQSRDAQRMKDGLDYWERTLRDAPPVLPLPTDRPRRPASHHRGVRLRRTLPPDIAAATQRLAASRQTTPFVVLLAAFHATLMRHTGDGDIVIGIPINRRDRRDVSNLMGIFADTLALRITSPRKARFSTLLDAARSATLGALEHQDVPFELVTERLRPDRELSHHPVFQAMFSVDSESLAAPVLPGLEVEQMSSDPGTSRFDLALSVEVAASGLSLLLEYDADLFDRGRMEAFLGHFGRIVRAVLDDPDRRVDRLPLADRQDVAPVRPLTGVRDVLARFSEAVESRPDAVAVEAGGAVLTYRGLAGRVAACARHLERAGVGPADIVAVMMRRGPDLPAMLLAVLDLGAAYVPIDPDEPARRRDRILRDSGARHLVSDLGQIDAAGPILVECPAPTPDEEARVARAAPPETALAYAIFTSGSTGRPKGVAVTRGNLNAFLAGIGTQLGTGQDDAWLAVTTLSFDISVLELLLPLAQGARVRIAGRRDVRDGHRLRALLRRHAITVLQSTPSGWRLLLDAGWKGDGLALALSGGERLEPDLAAALRIGGAAVFNLYGPTETTVWATAHRVDTAADPVPVGRPLAGVTARVYDPDGGVCAQGLAGELCIGGRLVACGYLGQAAETAQRFVPDPSGEPGSRMFRTGDTALERDDGTIIVVGRRDDQIKLRGHRIELAEVEHALRRVSGAREAAVVLDRTSDPSGRLVGFVTGAKGNFDLSKELPGYMRPAEVISLPAMPRLLNGKLDRQSLRARAAGLAARQDGPPRGLTRTETILAEIWAELLGRPPAHPDEDFFKAGGHSLLLTRLLARLRERTGVELPLSAVFEAPRLGALAARVSAGTRGRSTDIDALPPTDRLSSSQLRLWLLARMEPGAWHYHTPLALRFGGVLDARAMAGALAETAARHDILLTCYPETPDGPRRAHVAAAAPPAVVDLAGLPNDQRRAAMAQVERQLFRRPFRMDCEPPWRSAILHLSQDEHFLVVVAHHIAMDGHSAGLLFADLADGYQALSANRPRKLPPPATRFGAFVAWEAEHAGTATRADIDYWKTQLADAPVRLDLPTDFPGRPGQGHGGNRVQKILSVASAGRVDALVRSLGSTRFLVLLTAFKLLLGWRSGRDDVILGTNDANRRRVEFEDLIGNLTELLVLRSRLGAASTFGEAHGIVRRSFVDAQAHSGVGFGRLVEELRPRRRPEETPWVNVIFSHLDAARTDIGFPGAEVQPHAIANDTAKFDLTLTTADIDGRLLATLEYRNGLFRAATAERILSGFEALLEHADTASVGLGSLRPVVEATDMDRPRAALERFLRPSQRDRETEDGTCRI